MLKKPYDIHHGPDFIPLIVADIFYIAGMLRRHRDAIAATVAQNQASWHVLSAAEAGNQTVAQLARHLGVSRQSVQRIANKLARQGRIRFAPNPHHRRSPLLELKVTGHHLLHALSNASGNLNTSLAQGIRLEELRAASLVLATMRVHLSGPIQIGKSEK